MPPKVKICCIENLAEARLAVAHGTAAISAPTEILPLTARTDARTTGGPAVASATRSLRLRCT